MGIPENQLDIWAKQGSVTQSQATYATMRTVLDSADAPYKSRSYSIFLQGSYGNDTNIYADSDVDVVIQTSSVYYNDLSNLSAEDLTSYNSARSDSEYSYDNFKSEVTSHLLNKFGPSVKPGKKAIFVQGNNNRRDVDVLPAAEYRKYTRFRSYHDRSYVEGIVFWAADGTKIVNYPKLHSGNATKKHQDTNSWFKPAVRILKNMRNSMIQKGYIKDGVAPSYFLEGMLYNVPNANFGKNYDSTIVEALNWLIKTDRSKLACANEQYVLLHPTSAVTWREEHMQTYLDAVVKFWNEF